VAVEKLRVHIENTRKKAGIHQVTRTLWVAACKRHRTLARRLDVTEGWDGDILEDALTDAVAVIGVPGRRDHLKTRAPELKWLHAMSAGVDGMQPFDWLPKGVTLTNNSGAHGVKAGQYMAMAYNLINSRMAAIITNQQHRHWKAVYTPNIAGKTAVIIGLGDLGGAAAQAAKKLDLQVIGVRRGTQKHRHADRVVSYRQLDRVLPLADFVVLAAPLTAETRNLMNAKRLDHMKRGAGLINIGRGPLIDTRALEKRLRNGRLGGAVLDVVEPEPLPKNHSLWRVPNLIITPHVSCDDGERYIDISLDLWFENLARFLSGRRLKHRVDPKLGY